ncbi:UNVERIFIED_CONTAM: hypothetical protein NCL1_06730 [Trichonephila clavipes]
MTLPVQEKKEPLTFTTYDFFPKATSRSSLSRSTNFSPHPPHPQGFIKNLLSQTICGPSLCVREKNVGGGSNPTPQKAQNSWESIIWKGEST